MKYFDSHAHYYDERFESECEKSVDCLIDALLAEEVSYIINVGTSPETSRAAIAQAQGRERMYTAIGIHPSDTRFLSDIDSELADIESLIKNPLSKCVCLGEIGLDYHYPDGVSIPVNSLIYTITRMDGTTNRYFLRLNANSLSSPWGISFSQSSDVDYFTLPETSYSTTVYMIDGDEEYHQAFTYTPREKRVYFRDTNDVKFGLPRNGYPSPITLRSPALDYTPSDREIINGYIAYYPTGNDSYYYNTDFDFYVTYYSTNDQSTAEWLSSSALTAPFEQNYYYNDVFKNGDVINNNNVENKYLGAFAPIFDVDLSDVDLNALIPNITAAITPTLQLGIDSLFDSLLDFFGNMPDIGNQWDLTLDNNNYFDIIPLDPDDPGGGGSWDPPDYPAVNTSVYIPAVVPSYSTYAAVTAPANVLANSKNVLQNGWTFLDVLGLLPLIIPLTIVAILWRFTGE